VKKTKTLVLSIIFILSIILAGCGSNQASNENSDSGEKTYKLKMAGHVPDSHPSSLAMKKLVDRIKEESDGHIEIQMFPNNQLGDYSTVYEEVSRGTIDMALISVPTQLDKLLGITYLPYLVSNYEEAKKVYSPDNYIYSLLTDVHAKQSVKLLGFHMEGFGGIGSKKEIQNIFDSNANKDITLRVPQMLLFNQPMEDLGFRTTGIPYADLYTALQTGVADGWTGGSSSSNYEGFRDAIKYYYQTNDFMDASSILISDSLWKELSEEDQKLIQSVATDTMNESFEIAAKNEQSYRDKMAEEGIDVTEFSAEELTKLAELTRTNTWPKLEEEYGKDVIQKIKESIEQ
jgi:TRAP-type transport system periplasmic protein